MTMASEGSISDCEEDSMNAFRSRLGPYLNTSIADVVVMCVEQPTSGAAMVSGTVNGMAVCHAPCIWRSSSKVAP